MSNIAPSIADLVGVFLFSRWCPPQETSQPHPPHNKTWIINIENGELVPPVWHRGTGNWLLWPFPVECQWLPPTSPPFCDHAYVNIYNDFSRSKYGMPPGAHGWGYFLGIVWALSNHYDSSQYCVKFISIWSWNDRQIGLNHDYNMTFSISPWEC